MSPTPVSLRHASAASAETAAYVAVIRSRPDEFGPFIFAESARWGALAKSVGAKLD